MTQILRVFPRRNKTTPDDALARVGPPTLLDNNLQVDEVHISVSFTWDIPTAEELAKRWAHIAPVKIGGPAYNDKGGAFTPGMYLKPGYVITSRGCPNRCWFCTAWQREGNEVREYLIRDGWNILDNNILACSKEHQRAVFKMLLRQKHKAMFSGGLEAARLNTWHVECLAMIKPQVMWFAYDEPKDWEPLVHAAKLLRAGGIISPANHAVGCYVLCGYKNDNIKNAERRCWDAVNLGFFPLAMLYDKGKRREEEDRGRWITWARTWANAIIVGSRIRKMLSERRPSGILNQEHQPAGSTSANTEEESMSGKNSKKAVAVEELEVDDKMVVAAATDINKVLAPNPPLDLTKPGEDLQKDVEELFPNIIAADKLAAKTWDILKALGWKGVEPEPPKSKKPAKVTAVTPLAALATELNEVLAPAPLLDLADACLEGQVKKLAAQVKACDPLSSAAWVTLKKLGWKDKDNKVQAQKAAPVHPTTAAAAPQTYTMLKMPKDCPKQMLQIVGCLEKGPLAGDKLLAAMAKVVKTKQPLARILGFYQKTLVAGKYIKVS
jgi:hypothetical protein